MCFTGPDSHAQLHIVQDGWGRHLGGTFHLTVQQVAAVNDQQAAIDYIFCSKRQVVGSAPAIFHPRHIVMVRSVRISVRVKVSVVLIGSELGLGLGIGLTLSANMVRVMMEMENSASDV